jgi:hypothetical protein
VPEDTCLGVLWATNSACLNETDNGSLKQFDGLFENEFNDLVIGLSGFEKDPHASERN